MTLTEMREERATLVSRMREIHDAAEAEERDLTAEEQTEFDACDERINQLTAKIDRGERLSGLESHLQEPAPTASRRAITAPADPAVREFSSFGEFMHAAVYRNNDPRLEYVEGEPRAEQSMGDGPSGGFAIPAQFRSEMLEVPTQESIIRSRAQVIPAGSPPDAPITMPALDQTGADSSRVFGGVTVDWIEEGEAKPETDAKIRQITLSPHEAAAHVTLTDKLLRNWQASGPLMQRLLRNAIFQAEDLAFLRGDGVGKPKGLIDSAAAFAVQRATAGEVTVADLHAMVARIIATGGSPVWIANRAVMPKLLALQDTSGGTGTGGGGAFIWQRDLSTGVINQLLGFPIIWNQRSPALGSRGDLALVDGSHYLIKDGSGPFVASSEHVKFLNNKTVIKIFWNVDGSPWLTEPFKGEDGFETSPFVVLDVPAV